MGSNIPELLNQSRSSVALWRAENDMATLRPDRKPGANLRIDMEKWQSTEYHLSGRQGRTEYSYDLEGVGAFGPMASDRDLWESGRSAGTEV